MCSQCIFIMKPISFPLPLPIVVYKPSTWSTKAHAVSKLCPTSQELFILVSLQPRFILEGSLEILDQGQNARFGSALAPVPDLNGDSFNDVVVGAPLEDDHKGAIYIYHSQHNKILRKYKQVTHTYPAVLLCINYLNVFALN